MQVFFKLQVSTPIFVTSKLIYHYICSGQVKLANLLTSNWLLILLIYRRRNMITSEYGAKVPDFYRYLPFYGEKSD